MGEESLRGRKDRNGCTDLAGTRPSELFGREGRLQRGRKTSMAGKGTHVLFHAAFALLLSTVVISQAVANSHSENENSHGRDELIRGSISTAYISLPTSCTKTITEQQAQLCSLKERLGKTQHTISALNATVATLRRAHSRRSPTEQHRGTLVPPPLTLSSRNATSLALNQPSLNSRRKPFQSDMRNLRIRAGGGGAVRALGSTMCGGTIGMGAACPWLALPSPQRAQSNIPTVMRVRGGGWPPWKKDERKDNDEAKKKEGKREGREGGEEKESDGEGKKEGKKEDASQEKQQNERKEEEKQSSEGGLKRRDNTPWSPLPPHAAPPFSSFLLFLLLLLLLLSPPPTPPPFSHLSPLPPPFSSFLLFLLFLLLLLLLLSRNFRHLLLFLLFLLFLLLLLFLLFLLLYHLLPPPPFSSTSSSPPPFSSSSFLLLLLLLPLLPLLLRTLSLKTAHPFPAFHALILSSSSGGTFQPRFAVLLLLLLAPPSSQLIPPSSASYASSSYRESGPYRLLVPSPRPGTVPPDVLRRTEELCPTPC
eukprot:826448-Rhodomonas_salina.1